MAQNTSHAVMAQRTESRDSLDDFPTPPWATRALCEFLLQQDRHLGIRSCREPAANRGHMVTPLREYFAKVFPSDIHDYGVGYRTQDFLNPYTSLAFTDWVVTNPPFRLAEDFALRALRISRSGVALLTRTAFLEGQGRFDRLFNRHKPSHVLQFSERVVIHKGRLSPKGSTATAYCWVVWLNYRQGQTGFDWIPPCRKRLERPEDYA